MWTPAVCTPPGHHETLRVSRALVRIARNETRNAARTMNASVRPGSSRSPRGWMATNARTAAIPWILVAVDVPVQYFQSVIAIELAVAGALLWQIRYFESPDAERRDGRRLPDPRLRLGMALVLGLTLFGSLWAMADEGPKWAALAVTVGLAISLIPILLRVLPPLAKDARTKERDPEYGVTVLGLALYVLTIAGVLVLLDVS
jgi:hypothetical protein